MTEKITDTCHKNSKGDNKREMVSRAKEKLHKVFTYGTLKTGQLNHHELTDPKHGRCKVCKISLSFRFRISLSDMTNYKLAFGKVCRIKNRQTFKKYADS